MRFTGRAIILSLTTIASHSVNHLNLSTLCTPIPSEFCRTLLQCTRSCYQTFSPPLLMLPLPVRYFPTTARYDFTKVTLSHRTFFTHLPLPQRNINPYLSLWAKRSLREGAGGQFPRNIHWSKWSVKYTKQGFVSVCDLASSTNFQWQYLRVEKANLFYPSWKFFNWTGTIQKKRRKERVWSVFDYEWRSNYSVAGVKVDHSLFYSGPLP